MIHLVFCDSFIKGMRKHAKQCFSTTLYYTIKLKTEPVLVLELDGFRFSFYIAVNQITAVNAPFVIDQTNAAILKCRQCNSFR